MFHDLEQHEMELVETHPDGAEEWLCPTCNRRFLMYWPPNFKRVILQEGDVDALHSGGKNGVQMGTVQADEAEPLAGEDEVILSEEMRAALNALDWGDWA